MVERPIKKSERVGRDDEPKQSDRKDQGDTSAPRRDHKEKGGRGKGRGDREERKPDIPLALVRGPKPKPPKKEEPQPEVAETNEATIEEAITEASPEAPAVDVTEVAEDVPPDPAAAT
jgi:hypothetical protein